MRRLLLALALIAFAAVIAAGYSAYTRDVEYRRLIDEGQRALDGGEPGAAIEAFSGAIALRPDAMLGWYKRGETYRLRGELGSAVRDLRQATAIDPGATRPMELLGDVLFALERYARAAETYDAYLALDDRSPRVLYKLALSRFREGGLEAAESALTLALQQQDRLPEAHYLTAVCLAQRRRATAAIAAARKAVEQAPAMVEGRELLASLYQRVGRPRDEARQLEALAALDPDDVERHVAVGLAYARQGRRDQAVATLERAARDFPASPSPYIALGRVWLAAGGDEPGDDVARARQALQRGVSLEPSSEALTLLGDALLRSGEAPAAVRTLEKAAARAPVDAATYPLLASAAERTGRLALARHALVRAHALAGDTDRRAAGRRAARIAALCAQLGERRAASTWIERAVAASPDDVQLVVQLARTQWNAGSRAEARATLDKALARRPGDRVLNEARRAFR